MHDGATETYRNYRGRIMAEKQVFSKISINDNDEDDSDDEEEGISLKKQFTTYIQFKNPDDPGTHILLSQSDFWMKHAGVIQGRKITTTDTGVCFFKFNKYKLNFNEYVRFLEALAAYKKIPLDEIIKKLRTCGPPPPDIQIVNFPATPTSGQ